MKFLIYLFLSLSACCEATRCLEQTINVKQLSDLQLSPDNHCVLFVVWEPGKEAFVPTVYLTKVGENETELLYEDAIQPKWSPDGKWISFLSRFNQVQNLFILNVEDKRIVRLTDVPTDIQSYRWSPNGKQIIFLRAQQLWIFDIESPQSKPLTPDNYCVRNAAEFGTTVPEYDLSSDGKTLVFAYSSGPGCGPYYREASLATIDLETGAINRFEKEDLHESFPIYSPDGSWIAYLVGSGKLTLDRQLVLRSADGKIRKRLAPSEDGGIFYWGSSLLGWSQDGQHLLFLEAKGTRFHLMRIPIDGTDASAMEFDHLVHDTALSPDRSMLAFSLQNLSTPPEGFVSKLDSFEPIQISWVNKDALDQPLPHTEVIKWLSTDGLEIEGLLTYPLHYQKGKRYPILVEIHGGPMGFFYEGFIGNPNPYPYLAFTDAGFMIFRPNPRGSCGYGISFREANVGDIGGGDYEDIMAGVKAIEDLIDTGNMGIMGWSYGGYMVQWMIGQTSLFKAASTGGGYCNLVSFAETSDSIYFLPDFLYGNVALYRERSPLFYVQNVTTPCLLVHGLEDQRVPVSQAYDYSSALKKAGKQVELRLYPGMGHSASTPAILWDVMKVNLDWFIQHLMNEAVL